MLILHGPENMQGRNQKFFDIHTCAVIYAALTILKILRLCLGLWSLGLGGA